MALFVGRGSSFSPQFDLEVVLWVRNAFPAASAVRVKIV
jgi:hypothetical protein